MRIEHTLPSDLPEAEKTTFEKLNVIARNPPSMPAAEAADVSLAVFLLGAAALVAGLMKRNTAGRRPTIVVPKLTR